MFDVAGEGDGWRARVCDDVAAVALERAVNALWVGSDKGESEPREGCARTGPRPVEPVDQR